MLHLYFSLCESGGPLQQSLFSAFADIVVVDYFDGGGGCDSGSTVDESDQSSYLSRNLADRWGTTVDFTTSLLHSTASLA